MGVEDLAVASGAVFDEFGYPGNRRSTGSCELGDFAVAKTLRKLPGDFQTLSPGLQFAQGADVAQEVRHFLFILTTEQRLAYGFEPGLFAVGVFSEAFAGGHGKQSLRE